jgi:hypothetical protein
MLADGHLDLPRCRVIANGTAHLETDEARQLVDDIADRAPGLTTGQLAALIRRLCVSVDPEKAKRRVDQAREDRSLVIEPTVDGVADVHILGMKMGDARAFGRRVNRHMFSLQKEDRSGRTHDQLRADIATDMLLGGDATNGGRGLVDIHVPVSVLDGGSEPGEIGGLGPVTADTARHIVETQSEADHQITLIDENGNPTHVYTLSRRATKQIRRHMAALQPTCTFPGCVAPAEDCDFDHLTPRSQGGETSTTNGGPKCDHDHTLKDHGWIHRRRNGRDIWVSPLGHTYITQGQSP